MVLVACGPYTTSDSITYDPLVDLIEVINKSRPDVCILVRLLLPVIIVSFAKYLAGSGGGTNNFQALFWLLKGRIRHGVLKNQR